MRAGFSKVSCGKQEGRKHKCGRIKTGLNWPKFRGSSAHRECTPSRNTQPFQLQMPYGKKGRQIVLPALFSPQPQLSYYNISGNHLFAISFPWRREPAASSAAQNCFSPVSHTCWNSVVETPLSVTSHQRSGEGDSLQTELTGDCCKVLEATTWHKLETGRNNFHAKRFKLCLTSFQINLKKWWCN